MKAVTNPRNQANLPKNLDQGITDNTAAVNSEVDKTHGRNAASEQKVLAIHPRHGAQANELHNHKRNSRPEV